MTEIMSCMGWAVAVWSISSNDSIFPIQYNDSPLRLCGDDRNRPSSLNPSATKHRADRSCNWSESPRLPCCATRERLRQRCTGRRVAGRAMIRTRRGRFFQGVRTVLPAVIFASSESPSRMPSLRRNGPGITTWPLVETFIRMARQSYPLFSPCHKEPRVLRKRRGRALIYRTGN